MPTVLRREAMTTRLPTRRTMSALGLATALAVLFALIPASPAQAAPSSADGVGVHRGGTFLLRDTPRGGPADRSITFGRSGDEPLVGDWNGDGIATVGVRRGSEFHLRNSNSGGPAHLTFHYGRADDEVVVGDWNGDGRDTMGVRRGDRFYLRNSNSGGRAHLDFHYGWAGDEPIVGDFDGDGRDTMGVRRGDRFYLRNSNSGGRAHLDFHYGRAGDVPLTGRWTAPETTTVGEFTTPLVPGQSRNVNIAQALTYIGDDVIAPGETYSLSSGIGPRTKERGFISNGAIVDGDLVSTQGGGISQVGVTFLNAAWESGIELRQFRPHSIYFQRYPMCRDATLGSGPLDVVVRNDTPQPISIETVYTDSSVTVRLVGVPWASVTSRTSSPYSVSGGAFSVSCSRTVTYPDGSTSQDDHTWRYNDGYPG